MGVSPITFRDIQAFRDLTSARIGSWECELIELLDDAVSAAFAEQAAKKPGEPELIPFTDSEGVKAFMTRLTIQQNARMDAAKKRGA